LHRSARRIVVTGRVQGVGFRPFVYVTAQELGITGSVLNGSGKVFIHAEGTAESLDRLEHALIHAAPPLARPKLAVSEQAVPEPAATFEILPSDSASEPEIHVPPDLFTCDDCVEELTNPDERRHAYPFINCTQCGPRYTIITAMPYDRPNTSLEFHVGGRHAAEKIFRAHGALLQTIQALEEGKIIAIKGVGGYHLVCDAGNDEAVARLRNRKHRPNKPLAVMFPISGKDGLDAMRESLQLDETSAQAITNPARPIVLVRKREKPCLSEMLAPGLNELGVFLPYSPLHHQLLKLYGKPIVATSGNISGEPVITDNDEARQRLVNVADAFLHHNRPIVRPADDPVIRPICGKARVIRLGRGIAPLELQLPSRLSRPMLATGGHMKVTVALGWDDRVIISPHIGDLDSPRSNDIFSKIINDIQELYDVDSQVIACDLHPGYSSTRWAQRQGLPLLRVQHHAAHASSLAGEQPDIEKWLIFTWDGVGYGSDGTLWGGEALAGKPGAWNRVASFRPFNLVGGDKAGREPWRSAAALMWSEGQDWLPDHAGGRHAAEDPHRAHGALLQQLNAGANLARKAWNQDINVFQTSAAGRLFDAAAALVLNRNIASFEGQGPMELEHIAETACDSLTLPLQKDRDGIYRSDWAPLLEVLNNSRIPPERRAGIFHQTMAQALVDQALTIRDRYDYAAVGLSGGVFQNRLLTELVVARLQNQGIEVRLHKEIPANDGGLCFGQIIEAMAM